MTIFCLIDAIITGSPIPQEDDAACGRCVVAQGRKSRLVSFGEYGNEVLVNMLTSVVLHVIEGSVYIWTS